LELSDGGMQTQLLPGYHGAESPRKHSTKLRENFPSMQSMKE